MTQWHTQERPDPLGEDEVHLWTAPLTTAPEKLFYFKSILSVDEKERARRFRKISDGKRYLIARGSLRCLLGSYIAGAPDQLRFTYGMFGKPSLSNQTSKTVLNFSVSHSEDRVLFGFARGRRIGVDLEYVRSDVDALALAKRYFSPDEFQRLRRLPATERYQAFYCAWTRKEAYLKACCEGLSFGLERVEVSFSPAEPVMIRNVAGAPNVSAAWTLKHLSPDPSYVGAAAVEDRSVTFRFFRLPAHVARQKWV
jgi:4'-phosphopantetheinyl transferase